MTKIDKILTDPATSNWLHDTLLSALERDPVDVTHDMEALANALVEWTGQLETHIEPDQPIVNQPLIDKGMRELAQLADTTLPTINQLLSDPACSNWFYMALTSAMKHDPVDSANDAALLAKVLDARCKEILDKPLTEQIDMSKLSKRVR